MNVPNGNGPEYTSPDRYGRGQAPMTYDLVNPMTREQAAELFAQELAKPDPDPVVAFEQIVHGMNVDPLEVLITNIIPVEWQAALLPYFWSIRSNMPLMVAGTDTFVRLFERVGFVSDFEDIERPTEPMAIFRGVTDTQTRLAKRMSWTTDLDKARWFSHRLDHLLDPSLKQYGVMPRAIRPTVWNAEISPEGILALFYEQNELEVVVNPRRLQKLQIVEQTDPEWPSKPGEDDIG